jgi:DNA modification methylase
VCGFDIRAEIIWAKRQFIVGRGDYHWGHEACWYAVKEGCTGRFYGDRKNTTLWADIADTFKEKDQIYAAQIDKNTIYTFPASSTTVWQLPADKRVDGGHSTKKPVECMARPMRNHGLPGEFVYDPFAGTGTTGIAAQRLNRKARLIEIKPDYCAVILQRFQDAGILGKRIK